MNNEGNKKDNANTTTTSSTFSTNLNVSSQYQGFDTSSKWQLPQILSKKSLTRPLSPPKWIPNAEAYRGINITNQMKYRKQITILFAISLRFHVRYMGWNNYFSLSLSLLLTNWKQHYSLTHPMTGKRGRCHNQVDPIHLMDIWKTTCDLFLDTATCFFPFLLDHFSLFLLLYSPFVCDLRFTVFSFLLFVTD